jgi:hypothetical protein
MEFQQPLTTHPIGPGSGAVSALAGLRRVATNNNASTPLPQIHLVKRIRVPKEVAAPCVSGVDRLTGWPARFIRQPSELFLLLGDRRPTFADQFDAVAICELHGNNDKV